MVLVAGWRAELEVWLRPFLEALRHPARRAMCPLHVAGLIGPGEHRAEFLLRRGPTPSAATNLPCIRESA